MKKLFAIILTLTLIFSLSACGAEQTDLSDDKVESVNNSSVNSQPQTVVVPNVVGMDKDEAVKTLEDLGLKVEVEWGHYISKETNATSKDFTDLLEENKVYKQDIREGMVIIAGSKIILTCNTNTDLYEYKVNGDSTVTLTRFIRIRNINNKVIIPTSYDGFVVKSITSNCLDDIYQRRIVEYQHDDIIVLNPNINIEGQTIKAKFITE